MEQFDKKITKIHNYIYANEGLSNSETLNEFLKLFYCKIIDEESSNELTNIDSKSLGYLNELFEKLKSKLNGIIDKNEKIYLKSDTIIFILNELKDISLRNIDFDVKGHILQKIIDRSYRESRGQFFTPSPVVDFMVKLLNPQRGEIGCDPASGTGGFMFSALEYISKNGKIENSDLKNIYFYDISESLLKLVAMRMMFEFSEDNPNLIVQDSISSEIENKYDFILTNPPFGTQGKILSKNILSKYTLGCDEEGNILKSQVPDILFVEKVIRLLKENGRAAIVLPDGDFENPSLEYFRRYLISNVRIEAIISLPDGTFIPYGTGVQSSIIFFTKIGQEKLKKQIDLNYQVFYGKITKLGYTFSKHSKDIYLSSGKVDEDYSAIIDSYKNKKYDDNAYLINIQDIINNGYILTESFFSPIYNRVQNIIKNGNFAKLKDLVEFKYQKEKFQKDEYYGYIEIADVNAYTSEIINSTTILGEDMPSRASYKLEKDDLIVATAGGSIGSQKQAKALITDQYAGCICTNGFTVMKAIKISKYYLLSFFNSEAFYKQILKYKYGTAIPCISREDFENILVPIPSDVEIEKKEANIKRAIQLREEAYKLMLA